MKEFLDMSYAELYRRTGVHSGMWMRYARKQANPNFATIEKISKALKIKVSQALELIDLLRRRADHSYVLESFKDQDESLTTDFRGWEAEPNMELTPEEEDEWANALTVGE